MAEHAHCTRTGITLILLRIVAGFLFLPHGAQKLFGVLGGNQQPLASMMGLAGVLEFFGGLLILVGLCTRPVAFILAGQMAVAYWMAHGLASFWPVINKGELAVLYCFVFLYLSQRGPGSFSIDGMLATKRASSTGSPPAGQQPSPTGTAPRT